MRPAELTEDSKALVLLCSYLALPKQENGTSKPLSASEWTPVAKRLITSPWKSPGALFGRGAAELWSTLELDQPLAERIARLLDRGGQLAFELERLTGQRPRGIADICAAAVNLLTRGPKTVLVTSLAEEAEGDEVAMLAVTAEGAWRVATPRLPMTPNGAGDAVAALFLGFWLKTRSVPEALGAAAAAIFEILQTTLESGEEELQLVAAQNRLEKPRRKFTAERI